MRLCASGITEFFNHKKLHQRSEQHVKSWNELWSIASLRLSKRMFLNNFVLSHFLIPD